MRHHVDSGEKLDRERLNYTPLGESTDARISKTGRTFDQVVTKFRAGKGRGETARDNNAALGELISDVRRSHEVLEERAEDNGPHGDMGKKQTGRARSAGARMGEGGKERRQGRARR